MNAERVTLAIYGLSCWGGGALTIERALAHMKGVVNAYVNPATEIAYVQFDPDLIRPSDLVRVVEGVGFGAGELTRR